MILLAGDGDPWGGQIRVRSQKRFFDDGSREGDSAVEFAKDFGAINAAIGFAGQGEIICGVEPAARSVFLPLMPRQPAGAHDIGHGPSLRAAGRALSTLAVGRVAPRELRPKPMQGPTVIFICVALRGPARIAGQFAPIGRPRQRHDVVIEFARTFPLGHSREGREQREDQQTGAQWPHWVFPYDV